MSEVSVTTSRGIAPGTQTLARGLALLQYVSGRDGVTVQQAADHVGIHRTMALRALNTLADFHLVWRGDDGRYRVSAGVLALSREFESSLRAAARPVLEVLAETVSASACLFVAEGDSAVSLIVIEPRTTDHHLATKAGYRHPLGIGSAGYALSSLRPPRDGEHPAIAIARARGYATSQGEVEPNAWGVSVPLPRLGDTVESCVHLITHQEAIAEAAIPHAIAAADEIARRLDARAT